MNLDAATDLIREHGYLFRFENTDGWFAAYDKPPKSWPEIVAAPEIPSDAAYALIEAGLVKERLQYSTDGTLVWVYTLVEKTVEAKAAA